MRPFPLPKTIRASKVLPKENEFLLNSFYADGKVLSRPGVAAVASGIGTGRGLIAYNGELYAAVGLNLYHVVGTSLVDIGQILGSKPIQYARGFQHTAICSPGVANYTLTTAGVLAEITDPDLPKCVDVERIDGYFLWVPDNGDPVIFSAVNDAGDIDPLDYFDAETVPDGNTGVIGFRNDLFVLGAETIERFRNAGSEAAPFLRVSGGMIQVGYVGGKIRGTDTFAWLGKDQDKGYGFFAYVNGTGQRISTPAIDEILQHDYTPAELADVTAQRFSWRGHDLYVWSVARHSFCFVAGNWSYFASGVDTLHAAPWAYRFATQHNGAYYVTGPDGVAMLSAIHKDEDAPIDRRIVTFARSGTDEYMTPAFLRLAVGQGLGCGSTEIQVSGGEGDDSTETVTECTVGLRLSRDGKLWTDRFYRELGAIGNYEQQLEWRYPGGLGRFDGFMGIEISTGSDCEFAADNAVLGL